MTEDLGPKPKLEWLATAALGIDDAYQRDINTTRSKALIDKIATEFYWPKFGVLFVVKNPRALGYFVVDGQHRCEAAKRRGVDKVPCVVLPYDNVEDAAKAFVAINNDRVNPTPLHLHHAKVVAGDPLALQVKMACELAKVRVLRTPQKLTQLKPGDTMAIGSITSLVRNYGVTKAAQVMQRVQSRSPHGGSLNAGALRAAAIELGVYVSKNRDHSKPENTKGGGQKRRCLGIGPAHEFWSTGPGHRICDECKARSEYREGSME